VGFHSTHGPDTKVYKNTGQFNNKPHILFRVFGDFSRRAHINGPKSPQYAVENKKATTPSKHAGLMIYKKCKDM
jgi:hypothetical protein